MKNTNWKLPLIIGAGVIAVILLCVFGVQSSQNKAIALEEQVNTATSDINVQEKRRVDLVYNLADAVMQYDEHEAETLKAIAEGRGSTGNIENVTTAITAVAEAYPELKSNENYKTLMNELSMTENLIAEYPTAVPISSILSIFFESIYFFIVNKVSSIIIGIFSSNARFFISFNTLSFIQITPYNLYVLFISISSFSFFSI